MNEILDKPAKKTSRKRATKGAAKTTTAKSTRAKRSSTKKAAGKAGVPMNVTPEQRLQMIAEAAYFRAEARGFAPGHETEDWLAAEAEVDRLLSGGSRH